MGKKSIEDANQRVATTRVIAVSCEPGHLAIAIQGLFDKWNAASDAAFEASLASKRGLQRWASSGNLPFTRHYFLLERSNSIWVTFGVTASRVAEKGFNPHDHGWLSVVVPDVCGPDGKLRIQVTLAKWSVNDSQWIWNGTRYVQMLDGLVAGLSGHYVSTPIDEADHHFINYA